METCLQEMMICEDCHIPMDSKPAETKEMDINKLSLFVMFRIQQLDVFECPCCRKLKWQLKEMS